MAKKLRRISAENALKGKTVDEVDLDALAGLVREAVIDPLGDIYASGESRIHLATVLTRRALREATGRSLS